MDDRVDNAHDMAGVDLGRSDPRWSAPITVTHGRNRDGVMPSTSGQRTRSAPVRLATVNTFNLYGDPDDHARHRQVEQLIGNLDVDVIAILSGQPT